MKTVSSDWFPALGWMLLGAALVCFTALTPLPFFLHLPPFPGGGHMALLSGSMTLISAVVCLLLHAWRQRRTRVSDRKGAPVTAQAQEAVRSVQCEKALPHHPDRTGSEEAEHVPLWLLRTIQAHSRAGRASAARALLAEWDIAPGPQHAGTHALLACHVCGLPDLPSMLFLCAHCQHLAHGTCLILVRQVQEEGMTLSVDPKVRPCCQSCLVSLLAQGWTFTRDDDGWLLIRRSISPDEF